MKKIYSLLIGLLVVGGAFAQGKTAIINQTATPIVIDGQIEDTWAASASVEKVAVNFKTEVPTLGNSTWQGLYDDTYFYVVVFADDDNHYPAWKAGSTETWTYDKPEVYWDVNEVLADGVGAGTSNTGHYQLAAGFLEDSYDTEITVAQTAAGNQNPGGTYAYSLIGEGYVYEHAVPWASFTDKDGNPTGPAVIGTRAIGFDVTIIDQDDGVTTARQRANWCNAGGVDEAWNNMDDAGQVTLHPLSSKTYANSTMSVYPNPVIDNVTINANFNKVVISNILGQQVKSALVSSKTVNVSDLSKGVYVIKAYNNQNLVGTAKITKN
jgi:hypothetical protein